MSGGDLFEPTIDDLIACADREITMRERVYPRRVADGRLRQAAADREIALMRSVRDCLGKLRQIDTIAAEMGHSDTLGFKEARERLLEITTPLCGRRERRGG